MDPARASGDPAAPCSRSPRAAIEAEADTIITTTGGDIVRMDSTGGSGARLAPKGACSAIVINKTPAARFAT
jgi:hypothetical protein